MFELEGESPEQRRERLRRQRKAFLDFIYRDMENLSGGNGRREIN